MTIKDKVIFITTKGTEGTKGTKGFLNNALLSLVTAAGVFFPMGCLSTESVADPVYQSTWDSLSQHKAAPEWLKDAKLGIYFHWGPYSVPAYGNEWYPRWMHFKGIKLRSARNPEQISEYHTATYGDPSEFGYHEFVKDFTGEHFDAADWARLFKRAGAKFAGPVAEHHDGFAMWDSEITPWNAADRGPKQDIVGKMLEALKDEGLKTITTFHHAKNFQRYVDSWQGEGRKGRYAFEHSQFPYRPGFPTASDDPELQMLYGNMDEEVWNETMWLGKLKEVVDNYQPDIVWFDTWLDQVPESYRRRFCSYYLNAAEKWHKEVVIIRKQDDLPLSFTVNDHEKSREPNVLPELWMTDDTLSTFSWSFTEGMELKPLEKIVHALVDTVSKNGVMLLNVSPKADGTIPHDQRKVLHGLGDWLQVNGEAIYNTRPWAVAAEGPTAEPEGGFAKHNEFLNLEYTAEDIRYTTSKDGKTVYAMTLGIQKSGESVELHAFKSDAYDVKTVSTLSGQPVKWSTTEKGLVLSVPDCNDTLAIAYKIEL